jgi:hypothetical protein
MTVFIRWLLSTMRTIWYFQASSASSVSAHSVKVRSSAVVVKSIAYSTCCFMDSGDSIL